MDPIVFRDRPLIQNMDRLETAVDVLVKETCEGLLKPRHIRAAAKKCGLKLDKKDAGEATMRLVKLFEEKWRAGIDKVIQDSKIEEKLANLEVLAKECKKKCEEYGVEDGYRPLGVDEDLEGHIYPIVAAYQEALTTKNEELEQDIETTRELLKEATDEVNQLAEKAEALMAEMDE